MRLLLLAFLPACSLYFGPGSGPSALGGGGTGGGDATTYDLVKTRSIAGERTVAGIDSDGAGGLWIVYRNDSGDYYANKDVWVTHLDASGAKVSDWYFNDDYTEIGGIAFAGDAVWVNYNSTGTGNNHLRKLDATTGATLATFAMEVGIVDVSYDAGGDQLILSNLWNQMVGIDPNTGGELWRTNISAMESSTQRGLAFAGGRIWLDAAFTNEFFLVDQDGTVEATASSSLYGPTDFAYQGEQLAWDGSQLIATINNQIIWFKLQPR